ncbi:MAG: sugar ABC transporter permease [Acidimicrobiia bacterium]|nr:sugar ABC transporter permease [Acidimicrobiia bacterium]NNF11269.1 sugar ABC transporter permease [Acidimicrobiia bacterium]NNL69004.1 sugar ABC transporter permease [Acidimicrobiia bacterium]
MAARVERIPKKRFSGPGWRPTAKAYVYLFPTFFILAVFVYFPIIESFRLSLNRVAPFGNQEISVGFDNYRRLLTSPDFWDTVKVSVYFMIGTVPVGIGLAVAIAILLAYPLKRLNWFYRTLIFVPVVISSAIAGTLFKLLYNPVVGFFNHWLSIIGIDGPNWLNEQNWAVVAVTIAVVWRQLGFNVIIALAGIQAIDEQLYEAAKVDGAGVFRRIWHITLPMLSPTLFFLAVVNVIISLQAFGEINILTDGGPGRGTTNLVYQVFVDGFVGTRFVGRASAQAFLLAIMIIGISIINFRGLRSRVHYQ